MNTSSYLRQYLWNHFQGNIIAKFIANGKSRRKINQRFAYFMCPQGINSHMPYAFPPFSFES